MACGTSSNTGDTSSGSAPETKAATGNGAAKVGVDQVPVGNAVVIAGAKPYVVAQPTDGVFVAFDASCTHRGTTVTASEGLTLDCPAHGSRFDGATGAVEKGPAASPLAAVPVRREGDQLLVG
ncbi:QcrA and Rieske domain-containing protein [Tsukamurella spumae]|uniref:Cytochrome bc1 complex Rieske iron-sulfur subunit n=1 Tax=Tsukamurella spumae TaxID=44753 RepID=A0A846X8N9_9ACTN|nr:Rieske (2Fe-2S) protein [Tsukamurella spumae]NKY20562.1 Rieske (2Fe-2S) protein [Tsukamurella spumae]